ncbi:hypothetical protein ACRAWF_14500 [Streptomyces sp. L7]
MHHTKCEARLRRPRCRSRARSRRRRSLDLDHPGAQIGELPGLAKGRRRPVRRRRR